MASSVPASEDLEPSEVSSPQKKMSIREITEAIGKLYESMKSSVEDSQSEGKPMDGATEEKYDRMNKRLTDLITMRDQHYRLLDAQVKAKAAMEGKVEAASKIENRQGARGDKLMDLCSSEEYRSAFQSYLRSGVRDMTRDEQRAMSEGTDSAGGFLPSTEFYSTLTQIRYQNNAMRQIAHIIPLGTFNTEIAYEASLGTAEYMSEAGDVSSANESTPSFAKITLTPRTLRYFTRVSNELLSDSPSRGASFNVESMLAGQIGRVIGAREETAFVTGSGTAPQPKGIMTYTSGRVISDVFVGTVSTITAADLINLVAALPRAYREGAKFIMTDAIFFKIRQLLQVSPISTSGGGNYTPFAWSLGDGKLQDGEPDRLLGYPVVCVAAGATALTGGTRPICFGNFNYYHIGEREGVSIKVARETYLTTNQTGYFAFARHAADVDILDAFRYLKTTTS